MRCGATLLELLVVLTILSVVLGVAGLAIGTLRTPRESREIVELRAARTAAIRLGVPQRVHGVLFLPDGRAAGNLVDPLTGAPDAK